MYWRSVGRRGQLSTRNRMSIEIKMAGEPQIGEDENLIELVI